VPTDAVPIQKQLFRAGVDDPWKFAATLNQLAALVGSENVGTPQADDTHRPDAFSMRKPDAELEAVTVEQETAPERLPLRRYRPPLRVEVRLEDGMPRWIRADLVDGSISVVRGPWYGSGEWWDQQRYWNRIEWDIELEEGGLYRIFWSRRQWFLEGSYG
jgi:protein ImuB